VSHSRNEANNGGQTGAYREGVRTGPVDSYMRKLKHPLATVVEAPRRVILSAHSEIGEEIKWNVLSFFYTGPRLVRPQFASTIDGARS